MKVIIWKDKGPFIAPGIKLLPNVVYKVGKDISEEDALQIVKSYECHGMVEMIEENKIKVDKVNKVDKEDREDKINEDNGDNDFDDNDNFEQE